MLNNLCLKAMIVVATSVTFFGLFTGNSVNKLEKGNCSECILRQPFMFNNIHFQMLL